jgi:TetR/AcrR family transcriptional repressor of nem operon
VQAAAAAFRARGISGVRVEDVMGRAGLTHGGFYAHFASKDDLLRESLDYAGKQTVEMLSKPLADVPPEDRFEAVIDAYLSPGHVAHPEVGCPLASLGPEVARAGGTTQRSLAEGLRNRIAWMRQLLPAGHRGAISENQVIGTLASMIGGVILARSVAGKDSAVVLEACREFLHRMFEESAEHAAAPRSETRRKRAATTASSRGSGAHAVRRTKA